VTYESHLPGRVAHFEQKSYVNILGLGLGLVAVVGLGTQP